VRRRGRESRKVLRCNVMRRVLRIVRTLGISVEGCALPMGELLSSLNLEVVVLMNDVVLALASKAIKRWETAKALPQGYSFRDMINKM
jgi:hypothetical protein